MYLRRMMHGWTAGYFYLAAAMFLLLVGVVIEDLAAAVFGPDWGATVVLIPVAGWTLYSFHQSLNANLEREMSRPHDDLRSHRMAKHPLWSAISHLAHDGAIVPFMCGLMMVTGFIGATLVGNDQVLVGILFLMAAAAGFITMIVAMKWGPR